MNKVRNFVALFLIYIAAIVLTLYVSALCFLAAFGYFLENYLEIVYTQIQSYDLINWSFSFIGIYNNLYYFYSYIIQYLNTYAPFIIHNTNPQYQPLIYSFIFTGFAFIFPIILVGYVVYRFRDPIFAWKPWKKKESIHGDAKWAEEVDIDKAGLRQKDGMLLGQDAKGYYVSGGYQHTLLFAPTGSGKGVGFVIPNLLYWSESVLVHDIKLENFDLTSGWRAKQGQQVFVWEPANPDGRSHCYNPIDWISPKAGQMVDDVQKIANLLLDKKEFWENEARTLFVGICLYLIAVPDKVKSFGEIVRTLRSDDCVYNLAVVLDTIGKYIHPVAYMNLAAFLQKADKERSGVISTLNSSLELWANPLIDATTARSDFNIQTMKKIKTTVYIGLTPDNIKRLQPLMKIFYQQASEFLSRKMPKKEEEPYGVLFLMDEFPTLGKMEQFKTGIAYFRGYHVRLFLIIQDTEQLRDIYEEAGMNSFLSNSTYRITFSANNFQTAELISKLCGNKTVEQTSQNRPKFLDFNPASRSMHVSETQRALLLPQEVINLPRDDQIVLIESFPPIRSKKIKYYEDKFFLKRLLPPLPVPIQEPYDPNKANTAKDKKKDETAADNASNTPTDLLQDIPDDNNSSEELIHPTSSEETPPPLTDEEFKFDFNFDDEESTTNNSSNSKSEFNFDFDEENKTSTNEPFNFNFDEPTDSKENNSTLEDSNPIQNNEDNEENNPISNNSLADEEEFTDFNFDELNIDSSSTPASEESLEEAPTLPKPRKKRTPRAKKTKEESSEDIPPE